MMNIYIKGEYIELALFISRMCVTQKKRVAFLTDTYVDAFSFIQCDDLERTNTDYRGIDVYFSKNNVSLQQYDVVIFYNCEPIITENVPSNKELAIWNIEQGTDFTETPFKELSCRKLLVVKNYSYHPLFDITLQNYPEYEIYKIPYIECDRFEYMNLQYTSVVDYNKLSPTLQNLLILIIDMVKTGNAYYKEHTKNKHQKKRRINMCNVL